VARKAVVDGLRDAVIVSDPTHRIVDLNPAAIRLLGGAEELIGRQHDRALASWPELIALGRESGEGERLFQAQSGRWLLARASDLFDENNPAGRLLVVRDITAQRQNEQALAAARDRAIEASELKGQILAKVSHELRTPLGAILGYSELLHSGAYGDLSERQLSATSRVIQSTHFLTRLVNELLDQAQSESGRLQIHPEPTRIRELGEALRQQFAVAAQSKGLDLDVTIDSELPEEIVSDSKRLLQIASNLVSNALKFTSQGRVSVHLQAGTAALWRIVVHDTGMGIAPEHLRRIFEPFWQADSTLTREHGGYGLGLAITQQLVQLLGGRIEVTSTLGSGSTFTVALPLRIPAAAMPEPATSGPTSSESSGETAALASAHADAAPAP
jgi:PAS domain S-box-containing protein